MPCPIHSRVPTVHSYDSWDKCVCVCVCVFYFTFKDYTIELILETKYN